MLASLHRLRTPEQHAAVAAAARADNHALLAPTHAVKNDAGEVIGYVSICALPVVHVWMDTQRAGVRDSAAMLTQTEAILRDRSHGSYEMPCQESSPFYPYLAKAGFTDLGPCHLFHRKLED
jgi:hypothetical protein